MIWIIISVIAFFIFLWFRKELVTETFAVAFVIVIMIILGMNWMFAPEAKEVEKYQISKTTELIALNNATGISGSSFLLSGSVSDIDYYKYLVKTDKGYQFEKINMGSDVYLKEGEGPPRIEEYEKYRYTTYGKGSIWLSVWRNGEKVNKKRLWSDGYTIIHVPKNSVVKDYKVDLRN